MVGSWTVTGAEADGAAVPFHDRVSFVPAGGAGTFSVMVQVLPWGRLSTLAERPFSTTTSFSSLTSG